MKTSRIIFAAAICAALASCQKDAILESENGLMTEPVTISSELLTKTSLNGTEIHWTNDDVIAVFDNVNVKNEFTATSAEGSTAIFTGNVTKGTTSIYAVYPHSLAVSAQGGILKVNLPADQTSKAGSFAEEHNISVAKAEKTPGVAEVSGVSFKNACALLKFTVPAYLTDVQKVTVSSNTIMAGEMTIDYSGDAPVCSVSENGSKSISMTGAYEAGSTFWFVLAPVTLDGIKVNVETAQGAWQMSTDSQLEMTAGQYRNLGTLKLEEVLVQGATAAHTYADGILTGTEVKVNLGIPQNTAAYITALNLEVKNASGTVVRTLAKDSVAAIETISANTQWPYLPKGDYTVSGTYTLSGVTEKNIEAIAFSVTETPVFEMKSVTAYTSYNKYIAGDAAGANSLNGSTIYGVGADITVSDAILYNSNYNALTVTDNGAAVQAGDLAGRSWGSHTIKASFTLDGVTVEGSAQVEVTGIPYSYNFVNGSLDQYRKDGWATNGDLRVSNETLAGHDNTLVLSHYRKVLGTEDKKGYIVSRAFHLPQDINVQPSIHRHAYAYSLFGTKTKERTGYVGAVSNQSTSSTAVSYKTTCNASTDDSISGKNEWLTAFTLTQSSPYISIDCNKASGDNGIYYFIYEAHFRYAE